MNEARLPAKAATEAKLTPVPLVALVRGAGHVIDLFSIALLALIPLLFHQGANFKLPSVGFNNETIELITKSDGASSIGLVLALTPLPIIYLRLFFKRLMKTPTPGETIAGITSYSTASGIEGVIQESLYGLSQYVISIFAAVFACIATCALWGVPCVILEIIAPSAKAEEFLGSYSITIAAAYLAVCFVLSFIAAVGIVFVPHSREDVASFLDDYFQLEVKRLR
jgi:hypothetical protein